MKKSTLLGLGLLAVLVIKAKKDKEKKAPQLTEGKKKSEPVKLKVLGDSQK